MLRKLNELDFYYVVQHKGKPVGFIAGQRTLDNGVQQTMLAVHPDHEGMHIGRKLIEQLIAWAEQVRSSYIILSSSTNAKSHRVEKLYNILGFPTTGLIYSKRIEA